MKRILFLSLMLLLLITGCSNGQVSKGKTMEEVFAKTEWLSKAEIIHEEKISNGILVFYIPGFKSGGGSESKLGVEYLQKTLGGWVASHKGGAYSSGIKSEIFYEYIPAMKDSPFPIYYGEILEPSITKVIVLDEEKGTEVQGIIIPVGRKLGMDREMRIWYALIDELPGPLTQIKGIDDNGKPLIIIETDKASVATEKVN